MTNDYESLVGWRYLLRRQKQPRIMRWGLAIGALGLGTEAIVSTMYQNFLPALDRLDIPKRDAVFFPLHALVDDHHQATLNAIAVSLACSPEGRRDLEKGMHKALFLRAGFWDWMLDRARNPPDGATP